MNELAPAISTTQTGPLGICHLPRLWLKIILHAKGLLPADYRHGHGGFDELLCERLGLDAEAMIAYLERELPDYLTFERWVEQNAKNLTPETVAAYNLHVCTHAMGSERAAERRTKLGLANAHAVNAAYLNDLDDWSVLHAELASTPAKPATAR
ncbi:MAG: DUF5069 domain-containing protein [Vulcanimicrobiaceae bacterium]